MRWFHEFFLMKPLQNNGNHWWKLHLQASPLSYKFNKLCILQFKKFKNKSYILKAYSAMIYNFFHTSFWHPSVPHRVQTSITSILSDWFSKTFFFLVRSNILRFKKYISDFYAVSYVCSNAFVWAWYRKFDKMIPNRCNRTYPRNFV